jgi:hypothetical protein
MIRPFIHHRLGVVLRFIDVFTGGPIDALLDVQAPALPLPPPPARPPNVPWRAVRMPEDATYRFLASGGESLPAGSIDVVVTDAVGAYVDFEPLSVSLPRPLANPPTPERSDFLVIHPLWPTRRSARVAGETAVVGRIVSAGALASVDRLRIRLGPSPLPAQPHAYTDRHGDFLFRLPGLKRKVVGTVVTSTVSLDVDILEPPTFTTSVTPTSPAFPFVIPLGETTVIEIQVP